MSSRQCSKCGKEKDLEQFAKLKRGKHGRRAQCKTCDSSYRNENKKEKMPTDGEAYRINATTMQDHFYLHFGFTERRYNTSEWYDTKKYNIETININTQQS